MNKLGRTAMAHWKTYRPQAYAELTDPEEHFTQLGLELDQQIADLTQELLKNAPRETFQEATAARQQAQSRARETVLQEEVFSVIEPGRQAAELPDHGRI